MTYFQKEVIKLESRLQESRRKDNAPVPRLLEDGGSLFKF